MDKIQKGSQQLVSEAYQFPDTLAFQGAKLFFVDNPNDHRLNPCPLPWKVNVLTAGPPGKS